MLFIALPGGSTFPGFNGFAFLLRGICNYHIKELTTPNKYIIRVTIFILLPDSPITTRPSRRALSLRVVAVVGK